MKQYLDILRNILDNGVPKEPVRVNGNEVVKLDNGTIGLPNVVFSHNMKEGFPLLTTKKMAVKSMAVELEGFIQGITDKKWFQDRKCGFWDEWSNPKTTEEMMSDPESDRYFDDFSLEEYNKSPKAYFQKTNTDLGPIYGYQWRKFGGQYGEVHKAATKVSSNIVNGETQSSFTIKESGRNGLETGFDQLKSIADKLKSNPYDRRMVCSAWNPNQFHLMALPPCHISFCVVVYGNILNLSWKQRSVDTELGLPVNIASYALLLKLLAKHGGFEEGNLTGLLCDCHLYNNHIEQAKLQLTREPYPLPQLNLTHDGDIFNWTHKDFELVNYIHHPKITAEITV